MLTSSGTNFGMLTRAMNKNPFTKILKALYGIIFLVGIVIAFGANGTTADNTLGSHSSIIYFH